MINDTVKRDWSYRVTVNSAASNIRERVADWLRKMAYKIDGRITLACHIETTPELSLAKKVECLNRGFTAVEQSVALEVRNEAQEQLFQELNPDLFTKDERDKVRH